MDALPRLSAAGVKALSQGRAPPTGKATDKADQAADAGQVRDSGWPRSAGRSRTGRSGRVVPTGWSRQDGPPGPPPMWSRLVGFARVPAPVWSRQGGPRLVPPGWSPVGPARVPAPVWSRQGGPRLVPPGWSPAGPASRLLFSSGCPRQCGPAKAAPAGGPARTTAPAGGPASRLLFPPGRSGRNLAGPMGAPAGPIWVESRRFPPPPGVCRGMIQWRRCRLCSPGRRGPPKAKIASTEACCEGQLSLTRTGTACAAFPPEPFGNDDVCPCKPGPQPARPEAAQGLYAACPKEAA
jgi:hypothetical protein